MIELGKIQKLTVDRDTSVGMYLFSKDDPGHDGVLIPRKYIPEGTDIGDEIEVFVYKDSSDRIIATTLTPKLVIGQIAPLKVVQVTEIGAFLDWGLEKDLFLPFKEQTFPVQEGQECLVALYVDKSSRLSATMNIYNLLSTESPYRVKDRVSGIIFDIKEGMGAFVAVDNKYQGLIKEFEMFDNYKYGDRIEGRVTRVREDGKLYINPKDETYMQMDKDTQYILEKLEQNNGVLYLNDKSSPEAIKSELKMSKNEFKRAIGRLLKENKIKFKDNGIEIISKDNVN